MLGEVGKMLGCSKRTITTMQSVRKLTMWCEVCFYSPQAIPKVWMKVNTGLGLRRMVTFRDGSHLLRGDWSHKWVRSPNKREQVRQSQRNGMYAEAGRLLKSTSCKEQGEKENRRQGGEMAQWVKEPVTMSEVPPRNLHGKRTKHPEVVLWCTHTHRHSKWIL